MTDKQQIEELAKIVSTDCGECYTCEFEHNPSAKIRCIDYAIATDLYNAGYRKVPENAVVLTQEEYDHMFSCKTTRGGFFNILDTVREVQSQETAKDFIFKVESYLGYNDDNETFTKKELLLILAEVAKEQFGVEVEE